MTPTTPESSKLDEWIASCSQKLSSSLKIKRYVPGHSFSIIDNKLCSLLADAHKQACHARILEGKVMTGKQG